MYFAIVFPVLEVIILLYKRLFDQRASLGRQAISNNCNYHRLSHIFYYLQPLREAENKHTPLYVLPVRIQGLQGWQYAKPHHTNIPTVPTRSRTLPQNCFKGKVCCRKRDILFTTIYNGVDGHEP
jgi:hypothetical protein